MSLWAQICEALPVPEEFGSELPYVRFSLVTEDGASGEDLTLEFQEAEQASPATIQVSHSEWILIAGQQRTVPLLSVSLDAATGDLLEAEERAGVSASLAAALMQAASFRLVR
ncbi:hypothetical protein QE400_000107 [Xanthomonas sacchari]|uniref:hypothetical protein n=1 Tax=Xanthomonas sacchari TaxID=56458 RepID=UPI00278AF63B|nr:hypothetical protein [Xanthomonas sacchari]MDQ1090694.1 hypothetical protein [Xanthomonas sacchari]